MFRFARPALSRYLDDTWELWPFFDQLSAAANKMVIDWCKVPEEFREPCRAVAYTYWTAGTGRRKPKASTLVTTVKCMNYFLMDLRSVDVKSLNQVRPIHTANYVARCHQKKQLSEESKTNYFNAVEIFWTYRDCWPSNRLTIHPWAGKSACQLSGYSKRGGGRHRNVAKTPLIPLPDLKLIVEFTDGVLSTADTLLDERDVGLRSSSSRPLICLRDTCFFLLGLVSGMRQEEICSLELNAGRTQRRNGVILHWVKSIERKTGQGVVDYLMPDLGHRLLAIMERWSAPHRKELMARIVELESIPHDLASIAQLRELHEARQDESCLFLGKQNGRIAVVSEGSCYQMMRKLARAAGSSWKLCARQLRRTYAWSFVRHPLGDLRFLRDQLHHASISMTEGYASNANVDPALLDEIEVEESDFKHELASSWTADDTPLSGGAGRKIVAMKAHRFGSRAELVEHTIDDITIRSTGHSWCLTQYDGCGGAGLYESAQCADCKAAVIDSTFKLVWKEIHLHQSELAEDAKSIGEAAVRRVKRDLKKTERVLGELEPGAS